MVTTIELADLAAYLGYLAGCWGVGYVVGFQLRIIKQFFESAG